MRVLLVGLRQPGQVGWHCEHGLRQLGAPVRQVEVLDAAAHPAYRFHASPVPAVSLAAGALHKAWLNRAVLDRARALHPDLVLIIKGREVRPATLEAVRSGTRACLANWNTDNPFNPLNSGPDLLAGIPQYDCYFIWGRYLLPEIERAGARRAEYLPFAYNPALHRPAGAAAARPGNRIVFAGSPDPARLPYLRPVAGLDLGLWGNGWERLPAGDPLRARWRGVAEGEKLAPVLSACEIALNFVRAQNGPAHNMRTYEAPACGAFMLATRTDEQVELFDRGAPGAVFFDSPEDLREKAEYFLRHPAERAAIARRGYVRITSGANTYRDRMRQVLETVRR